MCVHVEVDGWRRRTVTKVCPGTSRRYRWTSFGVCDNQRTTAPPSPMAHPRYPQRSITSLWPELHWRCPAFWASWLSLGVPRATPFLRVHTYICSSVQMYLCMYVLKYSQYSHPHIHYPAPLPTRYSLPNQWQPGCPCPCRTSPRLVSLALCPILPQNVPIDGL